MKPAPDALHAFEPLIQIGYLPAIFMILSGAFQWYTGTRLSSLNRIRMGRLLVLFGAILLSILAVLQYFMSFAPKP